MLKKKITYTDYDGNERTEDFYFNLTKAEVVDMDTGVDGGMQKMLEKIVAEKDNRRIMETFKEIVARAYGEKSADGKRFMKSRELSEAFMQTEAYSELFMELLTNATSASVFINGILPQELAKGANVPTLVKP
jgi:hypothetical protein